MSKIRHLLTAGSLVIFRNGRVGISESSATFGRFIAILPNEEDHGQRIPTELWDSNTLQSSKDRSYDIVRVWKISSLKEMDDIISNPNEAESYIQAPEPYWSATVLQDKAEENKEDAEQAGPAPGEITVKTSLLIKINDKEVDLSNLSIDERKILNAFGII